MPQATLAAALFAVAAAAGAHDVEPDGEVEEIPSEEHIACEDGKAAGYPCLNTELVQFVPVADFGNAQTNDIWGWTDPLTGSEYALIGIRFGTAIFELDDHGHPQLRAYLLTRTVGSSWRDIKVYADHAFVVSEATGHGLQVFDLRRLRGLEDVIAVWGAGHYTGFGNAHNIAINEDTGYAYAIGTNTCAGGLHMVDISVPLAPQFVGCFADDGYTHDAQCVVYHGPDARYRDREICLASNENTLTVVDVTDKATPVLLSRIPYVGSAYTHQGWLTDDHRYFLLDDELDERAFGGDTRTFVWDVADLTAPFVAGVHDGESRAIDHNQYVRGNHVFQANYRSGIRILRLGDLSVGEMAEVAYFDTTPSDNRPQFSGTWSIYPYFESGYLVASDINRGLYVLKADLGAIPECDDGIDNDGDGLRDYPEDPTCVTPEHASESVRMDVAFEFFEPGNAGGFQHASDPLLRLAVLGSETVDVAEIDRRSLRLGPAAARPLAPDAKALQNWKIEGARDGYADLLVRFAREKSGIGPDDEEVCLTGRIGADPFQACHPLHAESHGSHHETE